MLFSENLFERHSVLKEIEIALRECNYIKYAAYRAAAKLQILQKALLMNKVSLKVISNVFAQHQLQQTENTVQLDPKELDCILSDIYFTVQNECDDIDINRVSQLMIAFLLNVYDKKMKNVIQVLSFKISLTLLCQAKPREKYQYLFDQLADHNKCLSKKKLQLLLKKITALTEFIGEGLSFGFDLIPGTIESCFNFKIGTLGLSEDNFISWLMQDPQMLVWLSTFYRLQISQSVTHNVKCVVCKIYPISGLRYKCLRCLSFDICQTCFFKGKFNKNHKLSHPVQEYCYPITSQQSAKAFLITLKNKLYKKNCKLQYLPALRVDSTEIEALGQSTMLLDEMEVSSRTLLNGSKLSLHKFQFKELQNIILHLERESSKLIPQIDDVCSRIGNGSANDCQSQLLICLKKHKDQIESHVQRLKLLKNFLVSSRKFNDKSLLASTPVAGILTKTRQIAINKDLEDLSPIEGQTLLSRKDETSDKKLMWDNYDFVNCGVDTSWEEMKRANYRKNEIFEISPESVRTELVSIEPINKNDESELCLSTWLGGKTLLDSDSCSRDGFTWLQDDVHEKKSAVEGITAENKETVQELQADLKQITEKLEELSKLNINDDIDRIGNASNEKIMNIRRATEMDSILVNLINDIEKLIEIQH